MNTLELTASQQALPTERHHPNDWDFNTQSLEEANVRLKHRATVFCTVNLNVFRMKICHSG